MKLNEISKEIIGAAIEVHRGIGPGEDEAVYEVCLRHELGLRQIPLVAQQPLPVQYKEVRLDCGYRTDLVVGDSVVVENKAVETVLPIHEAQLLTYMRLGNWSLGLLLNFNVPMLKEGIRRRVLDFDEAGRRPKAKVKGKAVGPVAGPEAPNSGARDPLTEEIIAGAIEVHRELGPGLLVSAYTACLCHELHSRGLNFECRQRVRLEYKGLTLETGSVLDLVVEGEVAMKLKSVDEIQPLHAAQLRSQMRRAGCPVGLLVNFNVPILPLGIHRCTNFRHPRQNCQSQ